MRFIRWVQKWYYRAQGRWDRRRYPLLGVFPDGTVRRMKDGSVVSKQEPPDIPI